jgi:hypothetical protein
MNMNEYTKKLVSDRLILSVVYSLAPLGLMGIGLLFWSKFAEEWHHPIRAAVLGELGALFVVTAVLTFVWDLMGKRAFADEILVKANMSRDLADAGVEIATANFRDSRTPWEQLFKNSTTLDIWVSYASTWRNTHAQAIEKLLSRKNSKLRVVLPDPSNVRILQELADRYEKEPEALKAQIEEAAKAFLKFRDHGAVEVHFAETLPTFSMYLFNSKAVFAPYNHRKGRIPVPAIVCDEDGFLFRYLAEEFEALIRSSKNYE